MKNTQIQKSLERLVEGNRRFVSGVRAVEPLLSHTRMAKLAADGQKPFAIVLTCSDSRSPVEMIFDQGLGDLFVVRVAGNVVAPSLLASIEFAVANFGSGLVVVLGHTQCGAVNATIQHSKHPSNPLPSPHLEELVGRIRPALDSLGSKPELSDGELLREATLQNIKRSEQLILQQSKIVSDSVAQGKLAIVGALLDISSGEVKFIDSQ